MRLPLATFLENRDSDVNKDARVVNGYLEAESQDVSYVIKRPGTSLQASGGGTGAGMFAYGDTVYSIDATNTAAAPLETLISGLS
jgi:hypothetical protein